MGAVHGLSGVPRFTLLALLALTAAAALWGAAAVSPARGPGYLVAPWAAGPRRLLIYYGWLNTSPVASYDFDVLVTAAPTGRLRAAYLPVVEELASRGVEVYGYLHDGDRPVGVGSSFRKWVVERGAGWREWLEYMESLVAETRRAYTVGGRCVLAGIFLDECDPAYLGRGWRRLLPYFNEALRELIRYIHGLGLRVFVNGVRAYARYADYYLWESFYSRCRGGRCTPDTSFMASGGADQYTWVNGYAKYEWLAREGLLGKTFAVTLVTASDPSWVETCRAGYVLASILGLAGWGCSTPDYNSGGGAPLNTPVEPPGVMVNRTGVASAVFMTGAWSVDTVGVRVDTPYGGTVPHHPVVDGVRDEGYTFTYRSGGLTINAYYSEDYKALYLYIEHGGGGAAEVLLDLDSNPATGAPGGADARVVLEGRYCVEEVYKSGGWGAPTPVPCMPARGGTVYEVSVPGAHGRFMVVWGGLRTGWIPVAEAAGPATAPCLLDPHSYWLRYGEQVGPVVVGVSCKNSSWTIRVAHPPGRYRLVIYTPWRMVEARHVSWSSLGAGAVAVEASWRGRGVDVLVVEEGRPMHWAEWVVAVAVGAAVAATAVLLAARHYGEQ